MIRRDWGALLAYALETVWWIALALIVGLSLVLVVSALLFAVTFVVGAL